MRGDADALERLLRAIDGRGYKNYRRLEGLSYTVDGVRYTIARVQGDPYAPPSIVYVEGRLEAPRWALGAPVALADYLYRRLYMALRRYRRRMGEGHSGWMGVPKPSNAMLRRSGLEVDASGRFLARVRVGLPSRRRRILGEEAGELLLNLLPRAFSEALRALGETGRLREHVNAWRLQEELRAQLRPRRLVAFVGDGSILPRRCGGCEDPLPGAVPFESPPSLRVEVETSLGVVSGMGVPRGFTVVAGAAFHGKTTLLEAIQYGIYNHVPGDGRERVVTLRTAVKVKAEDGRYISCVDISTFIHDLPSGTDTACFTTADASGATSTAASIQEAVEAGAELVLLDEDTTATNLLYSDERAERVVRAKTVTTLAEQAKTITGKVSVIVASAGSAPLLAAADTVIVMENYLPRDATREAHKLQVKLETAEYKPPRPRRIVEIPALRKPRIRGLLLVDPQLPQPLNLTSNEQLVEEGQYNLIATLLRDTSRYRGRTLAEIAEWLDRTLSRGGFAKLFQGRIIGPEYSEVRGLDLVHVLDRLPGLKAAHAIS